MIGVYIIKKICKKKVEISSYKYSYRSSKLGKDGENKESLELKINRKNGKNTLLDNMYFIY